MRRCARRTKIEPWGDPTPVVNGDTVPGDPHADLRWLGAVSPSVESLGSSPVTAQAWRADCSSSCSCSGAPSAMP